MTKRDLFCINIGRFSTSLAWFGDPHWGITRLQFDKPCKRWRVDFWRFGWRIELYPS